MIDQSELLEELLTGTRKSFQIMALDHPNVVLYTISIWTDVDARRSAVSFDTFTNSQAKRNAANTNRRELRNRFIAEGNTRRASLVPADMERNNNPADFEFHKVVVIDNVSLTAAAPLDDQDWKIIERVLEKARDTVARECAHLNLHRDAELGISGRDTWYHRAVRIPVV